LAAHLKNKILKSLGKKCCLVQLMVWTVKLLFLYSSIPCHVQYGNTRGLCLTQTHHSSCNK